MSATKRLAVLAIAAALAGITGCGSGGTIDKAGASDHKTTVIRLQMPDGTDPDGTYFAHDVARRSHGALKVVIDPDSYNSAIPANEARLTADVRAGRVGFAYQPARGWAAAGVPGFQALMAPFLVTTVAASEQLAASPVAPSILSQLSALGVTGLGLIPAEPRQVASTRPLITPAAWAGTRLRIIDNRQTAALVTALGAHPVQGKSSSEAATLLSSNSITGVETSPQIIRENSFNSTAPYLTSYALFPKFEVIVASQRAWQALSGTEQAAVRAAAADTRAHARQLPGRVGQELALLCQGGVVIDQPSAAQLAALAREAGRADPGRPAVTMMEQKIKALHGTGPQPLATVLPATCRKAGTAAEAVALHRLLAGGPPVHRGGSRVPPGTYVTTDTVADFRAGGQVGADWNKAIVWTIHLHPDGTVYQTQQPSYPDQPFGRGRYTVKGDQLTFTWAANMGISPETVRWSYFGGQLTFTIVNVQDTASRVIYTAHPWRKVS